jgi:hypothetical protein
MRKEGETESYGNGELRWEAMQRRRTMLRERCSGLNKE